MSQVKDCKLQTIGELPFNFQHGTCANYFFPEEKLLMCFDRNKKSGCRTYETYIKNIKTFVIKTFRWDGSEFVLEANQSLYGHSYTMLGNYKGNPFIVGDSLAQHTRVEFMDIQTRTWAELESYPFSRE